MTIASLFDHPALTPPSRQFRGGDNVLRLSDPADGSPVADLALDADLDKAVATAKTALPGWAGLTPQERASRLLQLADMVERHADELVMIESRNVGKPITAAREEVMPWVDTLRFTAGAARVAHGGGAGEYAAGALSYVLREPIGVVGLITPWNYPLLQAVWKAAPALAVGNTVVLKPSELTPMSTIRLAQLAEGVLPDGVLNVVIGDGRTGQAMVTHPDIGLVSLTGDTATGVKVAAAAAKSLKRVSLELGGKAPVVVFDDVDVEAVVRQLVPAGYINAGQDCTAACRLIVADAIYDRFVEAYVSMANSLIVGHPSDESTQLGPLVSSRQLERVTAMVDRAVAAGATLRCGGRRLDFDGFYFAPTVLTDVAQNSEIVQHEVFGPVVSIQRGMDDGHMLELANGVVYGLSASVWTTNLSRMQRFTRDLAFGTVWVNQHLPTVSEMPFGGFGHSGYGKELSMQSLEEYTRQKHVMVKASA